MKSNGLVARQLYMLQNEDNHTWVRQICS